MAAAVRSTSRLLLVAMGNKMFPEAVLIDEADMLFDGLKVSTSLFLRLSRR